MGDERNEPTMDAEKVLIIFVMIGATIAAAVVATLLVLCIFMTDQVIHFLWQLFSCKLSCSCRSRRNRVIDVTEASVYGLDRVDGGGSL